MAGTFIDALPAVVTAQLTDVFPVDQMPGPVTKQESNAQLLSLFQANGQALSEVNDTNVTMTLGGSPSTALLNATSMTLGWTGQLAVPRGGTGNSTFTAYSLICAGTTATGAFQNVVGTGSLNQALISNGPGALPSWQTIDLVTPAALTSGNDTNVTLTLGGTPATALLQATSITAGWTGTLAETRGGTHQSTYTTGDTLYASAANTLSKLAGNITTNKQYLSQTGSGAASAAPAWATISGTDITGAALTSGNDTNVTLTLGGTPATSLLRAASITAGWTGQLALTRGGTNASLTASNGGIFYSTASAGAILSGTATAQQLLMSGASTTPQWSTTTYPLTNAINTLLYASSANVMSALATANSAVLVTNSSGAPSYSGTMTNGQLIIGSTSATPTAATLTAGSGISITNGAGSISIASSATGVLHTVTKQTFSASGTYTPTSGMQFCVIECWGSGGGGGGTATTGSLILQFGGGGGAGSYSRTVATAATVGSSQTVTVGSLGTGGSAGANPGNNGGDVSVGTICIAKGGTGGGAGGGAALGGAGGIAGTGDLTGTGQPGLPGGSMNTNNASIPVGGGGSTSIGGGGNARATQGTGNAGTGFGAGGAGGCSFNAGGTAAGGNGTAGFVMITEYT